MKDRAGIFAGLVLLWTAAAVMGPLSVASAADPLDGFDAAVEQARTDWGAVGLAIAVVKDDQVAFMKGYGRRDMNKDTPVDSQTLFHIGSTTKAFVAMALGMLVDDGKIGWDDKVVEHLPQFRVADPYVTRELTIRDLLSHRSGVETADLLWVKGLDRESSMQRLQYAEQATSLRSAWEYNNMMYLVAGELIDEVTGAPFEDFIRSRIFEPLGMDAAALRRSEFEAQSNTATAHEEIDGEMKAIAYPHIYEAGGAGLINASVEDMSKWLRFLLRGGTVDGETLVRPETLEAMFTPQMAMQGSLYPAAEQADSHLFAYGLAWFLQDYRGEKMAMHTGSISGMAAIAGILPEHGLGVVVLINTDHIELRHALMYDAIDRYLGAAWNTEFDKDWSRDLLTLYKGLAEEAEEAAQERRAARVEGTQPSLPLDAYVGTYSFPLLGEFEVRIEDGGLVGVFGQNLIMDFEHWQNDTFRATYRDERFGDTMVGFSLNGLQEITGIEVFGRAFARIPH